MSLYDRSALDPPQLAADSSQADTSSDAPSSDSRSASFDTPEARRVDEIAELASRIAASGDAETSVPSAPRGDTGDARNGSPSSDRATGENAPANDQQRPTRRRGGWLAAVAGVLVRSPLGALCRTLGRSVRRTVARDGALSVALSRSVGGALRLSHAVTWFAVRVVAVKLLRKPVRAIGPPLLWPALHVVAIMHLEARLSGGKGGGRAGGGGTVGGELVAGRGAGGEEEAETLLREIGGPLEMVGRVVTVTRGGTWMIMEVSGAKCVSLGCLQGHGVGKREKCGRRKGFGIACGTLGYDVGMKRRNEECRRIGTALLLLACLLLPPNLIPPPFSLPPSLRPATAQTFAAPLLVSTLSALLPFLLPARPSSRAPPKDPPHMLPPPVEPRPSLSAARAAARASARAAAAAAVAASPEGAGSVAGASSVSDYSLDGSPAASDTASSASPPSSRPSTPPPRAAVLPALPSPPSPVLSPADQVLIQDVRSALEDADVDTQDCRACSTCVAFSPSPCTHPPTPPTPVPSCSPFPHPPSCPALTSAPSPPHALLPYPFPRTPPSHTLPRALSPLLPPGRLTDDTVLRYAVPGKRHVATMVNRIRATATWRRSFRLLAPAEVLCSPWRPFGYWHGADVDGRPCLVLHLGRAARAIPSASHADFVCYLGEPPFPSSRPSCLHALPFPRSPPPSPSHNPRQSPIIASSIPSPGSSTIPSGRRGSSAHPLIPRPRAHLCHHNNQTSYPLPAPLPVPPPPTFLSASLVSAVAAALTLACPDSGRIAVILDCQGAPALWHLPVGLLHATITALHRNFPHRMARLHVLHLPPALRLLARAMLQVRGWRGAVGGERGNANGGSCSWAGPLFSHSAHVLSLISPPLFVRVPSCSPPTSPHITSSC
ncbi:unnamed protein product [Closterium sp. Naga37s-1]|nr:unnamed protein product [Closterium sp. Naga37s-1]